MRKNMICCLWFILLILSLPRIASAEPFAYVTNYYSQDIYIIDLADNSVTTVVPTDQNYWGGVGLDEVNNKIYFGNTNSISVFDYLTDSYMGTFPMSNAGHVEGNIVVSSDGSKLYLPISRTYFPGQIERVEVIDTATYSVEKIISLEGYGLGTTFGLLSPDGGRLYISCRWSNNIVVIDTIKNEVAGVIDIAAGEAPTGLAMTHDGKKLYVLTRWGGGYINIIDTDPVSPTYHSVIKTVMTGLSSGDTALPIFSPDESTLYFTYPNANKLVVLNTLTDEIQSIVGTVGIDPLSMVISPGGEYLYIASWSSNLVEVVDTSTLRTIKTIPVGSGPWDMVYVSKALKATIDVTPDTLNLKSKGQYITCYIELPSGNNPSDIKLESIKLNKKISPELTPIQIADYDQDGILDLMVKFDREKVVNLLSNAPGVTKIEVSGTLNTGRSFTGSDMVKLLK